MSTTPVKACLRCHGKKIRCSGFPDCRTCRQVQTRCEAYTRPRKHETVRVLQEARSRVQWLEEECLRELGIDCRSLPTGTPLQPHSSRRGAKPDAVPVSDQPRPASAPRPSRTDTCAATPGRPAPGPGTASSGDASAVSEALTANEAPDVSLLALNATGELKYLGPSSGAFFASCAAALVRSSTSRRLSSRIPSRTERGSGSDTATACLDENIALSLDEAQLLLRSYEMWVHPLYPLLDLETLRSLVSRCSEALADGGPDAFDEQNPQRCELMTIFYQVMALGATNRLNTVKQLPAEESSLVSRASLTPSPSPTSLYVTSLRYFESCLNRLHSSVTFVQILLLFCIYCSYGRGGSSQWQLAGLAMRMAIEIGLHHDPTRWCASEKQADQRSRVFWTAYAIEIYLAYNLGRPPSIAEEHITVQLPDSCNMELGILHIKHRQIQGRIVSQMYRASSSASATWEERQSLIAKLQAELDEWRLSIPPPTVTEQNSPYPHTYWDRLYHSTCFVLHRTGPICPHPSPSSLEKCIRSAGAYIDNMTEILRSTNVPLSWMLVQGTLFAGLTMLITARANFKRLASSASLSFLLVDLPAWSRKCSVCLAIMNERWSEDLLSKLDVHFEALADDTLKMISTGLTSERSDHTQISSTETAHAAQARGPGEADNYTADQAAFGQFPTATPNVNLEVVENWEDFDLFHEVLGVEIANTWWDMYSPDAGFAYQGNTQDTGVEGHNRGLFDGW